MFNRSLALHATALALMLVGGAASAQSTNGAVQPPLAVFVGSETEQYLRILQTLDAAPLYPWSIRSFSPDELERLQPTRQNHPWAGRPEFVRPSSGGSLQWEIVAPQAGLRYNSAFPYGLNDGAVWAGRGLTSAVQLGGAVRWKAVSLVVAPIAFRAENTAFELAPNGQTGPLQYADATAPGAVDRPQRFGDGPYQRFDLGQTTLRVDAYGVAVGASTANQWWGPAVHYPYLLGNNAPGFPHVFVGTSYPLNVFVGRVHGRLVYGELSQSEYTGVTGAASRRFGSAIVGVFVPRWLPGLELGAARFYHAIWPEDGLTSQHFRKPLEPFLKRKLSPPDPSNPGGFLEADTTNQLASFFLRWAFPRSGFEIYGEYGREDHTWDSRDLLLEPDHTGAFGLGFRKAWARAGNQIVTLHGEILDYRTPILWRHRAENATYIHGDARGHTHRGQLLGADLGVVSAQGLALGVDRYTASGRLGVTWSSVVRKDGSAPGMEPDVQHIVGLERLQFWGPLEISVTLGGVYEFSRKMGEDASNFFGAFGVRWRPH
jgi:hypothetical protein